MGVYYQIGLVDRHGDYVHAGSHEPELEADYGDY